MNSKTLLWLSCLAVATGLTSCFDDGYDLSNIDTTSRVKVDNLVVPIQLDEVTLGDIITIKDDSKIKTVNINGKNIYALVENGDFHSDKIHINAVSAKAPAIAPVSKTLKPSDLPFGAKPKAIDIDPSKFAVTYDFDDMGQDFSYHMANIDEAVVDITSIEADPIRFTLTLSIASQLSDYEKISFSNMVIHLPKGLTASTSVGSYDKTTGVWTIDEYSPNAGEGVIWIETSAIDFKANDCKIENHTMDFSNRLYVETGKLTITPQLNNGLPTELPTQLDFTISFTIGDINATSFSGVINYMLDGSGLNINPVSLSDIPDFLSEQGTMLGLANPQIYLQVNNPVADDKLSCTTGIELTAIRKSYTLPFTPDDNGKINIGYNKGNVGPYNFVLAPSDKDLATPAGFGEGLDFVKFTGLRDLLLPDKNVNAELGLPDKIGIRLIDPQIPQQNVEKFRFGRDLPGVTGKYELMAPLALTSESGIHYGSEETGWNIDGDDGELTVEKLTVKLTVANSTPLGFELKAFPLDKNGNRIKDVEITASKVEANSTAQDVEITMKGVLKGLDGIEYVADAFADNSEETLSPDQTLKLSNIRVQVSGYYDYIDKDYNK